MKKLFIIFLLWGFPLFAQDTEIFLLSDRSNGCTVSFPSHSFIIRTFGYSDTISQIAYSGECQDKIANGSGECIYYIFHDKVATLSGYFVNGVLSKTGKLKYEGNYVYEGEFLNNCRDGKGTIRQDGRVLYEGEFVNDSITGYGRLFSDNGDVYEGMLYDGIKSGNGIVKWINGDKYDGHFVNDSMEFGTYTWANGEQTTGNFSSKSFCAGIKRIHNLKTPTFLSDEQIFEYSLEQKKITYPKIAITAGIQGTVQIIAFVSPSGKVREAKAIKSPSEILSKKAVQIIKSSFFRRSNLGEKNTGDWIIIPVTFKLK